MAPVLNVMIDHAEREWPLECCGLLYGDGELIDRVLPCTNESRSETTFSIPPQELFEAFRLIRRAGRRLMGIYHSHPRGPEGPSRRDIEEFEYREASCWIVSMQNRPPVVRCFRWSPGGFVEESIAIKGSG